MDYIVASNYSETGTDPFSWGIFGFFSADDADWIFDADDLTEFQALAVVEAAKALWPTPESLANAGENGTLFLIDAIVARVKAENPA